MPRLLRPLFAATITTLLGAPSLSGCTGPAAECAAAADCGEVRAACEACAPVGDRLCLEGTCTDRGADSVDVVANIQVVPRQLAVSSMVYVLASASTATGPLQCADAIVDGKVADGVNVLASGFKSLSGGSYFPAVSLGRSPEGTIAVLLIGTDGQAGVGKVVATGCVADLEAIGDKLEIELLDLSAL